MFIDDDELMSVAGDLVVTAAFISYYRTASVSLESETVTLLVWQMILLISVHSIVIRDNTGLTPKL